jgi:hypothetical protein
MEISSLIVLKDEVVFSQHSYDTGNPPGEVVTVRMKPYDSVPLLT